MDQYIKLPFRFVFLPIMPRSKNSSEKLLCAMSRGWWRKWHLVYVQRMCLWSVQPRMGRLYHTLHPKTQGHLQQRGQKEHCKSQRSGRVGAVLWTKQDLCTHPKPLPAQYLQVSNRSTPRRGAMDSWCLLGQNQAIFFKRLAPVGWPCSSGWHHTWVYKQHKLELVAYNSGETWSYEWVGLGGGS